MNGYGLDESAEVMRGGKECPLCKGSMSRDARFCSECAPQFAGWLRKAYKRTVGSIKPKGGKGGRAAVGKRSRQRTLVMLRNNGPMAARELAQLTGMTTQGVREQLHIMKETGEVVMMKEGHRHIWRAVS